MLDLSFIPAPKDAQDAAFQVRVLERGKRLIEDGYKLNEWETRPGTYFVHSPKGDSYIVDTTLNDCTCECCNGKKYCKHLIACHYDQVAQEDARDAARVAAYEAEQDACLLAEDMRLAAQLHREGIDY